MAHVRVRKRAHAAVFKRKLSSTCITQTGAKSDQHDDGDDSTSNTHSHKQTLARTHARTHTDKEPEPQEKKMKKSTNSQHTMGKNRNH